MEPGSGVCRELDPASVRACGVLSASTGCSEGWAAGGGCCYLHGPDQVSASETDSVHPSRDSGFWPKMRLCFSAGEGTGVGR